LESSYAIDWDSFDIETIPEDLIQKMHEHDGSKDVPKIPEFDNVVLDTWIFTE
jgi:hypothetical protein